MDKSKPLGVDDAPSPKKSSGWHRYFLALVRRQVKESTRQYYTRHAKTFCEEFREKGLRSLTNTDLTRYLRDSGRQGRLVDWHFVQLIHAIEIMLIDVVELEWAKEFDWIYWKNAARELKVDHPSIARSTITAPQTKTIAATTEKINNLRQNVEAIHGDALTRLRETRHYSIRTEQTYEHWILRFLVRHPDKTAHQLDFVGSF